MKTMVTFGAIALFSLALPFAARAATGMNTEKQSAPATVMQQQAKAARQEAATAQAHALMAAGADSLKMVHAHLQHVVNCLVGPGGDGYNAAAANPCNGMGAGALNDAEDDTKMYHHLRKAAETARAGLKADTLEAAHKAAKKTAELLQKAQHHD